MNDAQTKAKPYSPAEIKAFKAWGERVRAYYTEEGHPVLAAADAWLRWDATFGILEAKLVEVTAERDAAMLFVSRWLDGAKPRHEAERIREMLARRGYSQMHAAEMAGIATALEALPEEIPGVADVIEALYARKAKEETEG